MANVIDATPSRYFEVYASAARTTTPDTMEYELPSGVQAGHFVLDVTAVASTPSLVFKVEGVDRVSGKVYSILTGAAVATAVTTVYRVGPGLTAATNLVANDYLPPYIRFTVTHGNANSATYTLSGSVA
jgi:hypothetical protein